jgi:hypothetical protein
VFYWETENFSAAVFEWPLTLTDKCRMRVFDNRALRRIFVPKRDEVKREWRKLHNDLFSSPTIVRMIKLRRMRWAGYVACMRDRRGVYRVLVGKPEGKRPLGRPRHSWDDYIRIDLQEVGCGSKD